MKPPVAVVDTNIVVSGLITSEAGAATRRVLDHMLSGRWPFLLSQELLSEYRRVLLRPRIRRRHGLGEGEIDQLLAEIAFHGVFRDPPAALGESVPDPGDRHIWALLDAHPGTVLVTGDRALLEVSSELHHAVSAREFLNLLEPS